MPTDAIAKPPRIAMVCCWRFWSDSPSRCSIIRKPRHLPYGDRTHDIRTGWKLDQSLSLPAHHSSQFLYRFKSKEFWMPSRECPSYKKLSFNFLWQCLRNGVRRSTWREWITYNVFRQFFSLDPPTSTFLYSNLSCGSAKVAQSNLLQSHKNTLRCTPLGCNFWIFKNSGTKISNVICNQCPSLGQP